MNGISIDRVIGAGRCGRKSDKSEGDVMRRRDWLAGAVGLAGIAAAPAWGSDLASPIGVWRTIDDKTHKPRALVRIYARDGMLFGRVTAIFDSQYADARCQDCSGDRKNQPVIGLEIIRDMHAHGPRWGGGTILNPQTGDVYHCNMHLGPRGETLVVRGYIGFSLIGRSQTWERVQDG
jgi:uncharacterized protein (DUF2147 family)